jgi:hypothetical protein
MVCLLQLNNPAKPSKLEQSWAPGPIAESKFSEAEMARILIKTK